MTIAPSTVGSNKGFGPFGVFCEFPLDDFPKKFPGLIPDPETDPGFETVPGIAKPLESDGVATLKVEAEEERGTTGLISRDEEGGFNREEEEDATGFS